MYSGHVLHCNERREHCSNFTYNHFEMDFSVSSSGQKTSALCAAYARTADAG